MATTTPNYGWDVPTSTDYVKDGATAIETLGDDIDASLYSITGGKNVGLVHLNTTSFTSAATVQINNVYTTDYANYLFELRYVQNTSTGNLAYQNSLSGTPAATNYQGNGYSSYAAGLSSVLFSTGAGATKATISNLSSGQSGYVVANISSPAIAAPTLYTANHILSASGAGNCTTGFIGIQHTTATAYDGITLSVDAGTMTGAIRIYGLRNT
jgi:hypothetical protein